MRYSRSQELGVIASGGEIVTGIKACISYCLHSCDQTPAKSSIREEGFILTRGFGDQTIVGIKAWLLGRESAAHTASAGGSRQR